MTDQAPRKDAAVAAAQGLTGALTALEERLSHVTAYSRHTRRMIWATIISLTLDILLTVAIAIVAVQANTAGSRANQLHTAQVIACQANNAARAQQAQLWNKILALVGQNPPPPGLTPGQQHERAVEIQALAAFIHQIFSPRNCQALYRLP